ncbi:hypothetical protein MAPG_05197 [Magnaporthiopsis poae ATCC 64411]|uniref:Tafazzin n=1 Tax=Magnaporthiopsis poae (strain ATCC 64411 / 73-15) TaxID=644358 RepID=A0A0C4DYS1_MAGP6|nr:hypothetical protein MAPG_05197 [Magnaporthiopsis poae ATCC 64411]
MPKKRRPTSFTKPQSTAPPSLASSRARAANSEDHHSRGVNDMLADLRRVRLSTSTDGSSHQATAHAAAAHPMPSVPPTLSQILQLPETPATIQPRSRRPVVDARGRRLPPGPPAPRSWLSQSRHAPQAHKQLVGAEESVGFFTKTLPGTSAPPERGSLMHIALSHMAVTWEFQRQYNKYWLYTLPDHLRQSLVGYIALWSDAGVSIADLKALFLPPPDLEDEGQFGASDAGPIANENIRCLDLMGCLGKSMELKELTGFLFKSQPPPETQPTEVLQDSWDEPEAPQESLRLPLLPNLTRVSLAVSPANAHKMSWRQLLSFSKHAGGALTHLSLAHWPEPTLTPNAIGTTVDSPAGPVQYGGTSFYSHSLDDDWSEAVAVLKRLSKNLYGLEYLDLTGCHAWTEALTRESSGLSSAGIGADGDLGEAEAAVAVSGVGVDWAGAWGKVTMLLLHWGYKPPRPDQVAESAGFAENDARATRIERHIIAMRRGRGRWIEVAKDTLTTRWVDVNGDGLP